MEHDLHGYFPTQATGTIDFAGHSKLRFYFRARHNHWTFTATDDLSDRHIWDSHEVFSREGNYQSYGKEDVTDEWEEDEWNREKAGGAGFMPLHIARQLINQCVTEMQRSL